MSGIFFSRSLLVLLTGQAIFVIGQEKMLRIESRRPKRNLTRVRKNAESQEMVWYGFTENILAAKQKALTNFTNYRADGDWLRITPLMKSIILFAA